MTTYRVLSQIGGKLPGTVPKSNVRGLQLAEAWGVHQQLRAQDRVIGAGRRVILEGGIEGSSGFGCVASSSNPDTTTRLYPDKDTSRTVHRAFEHPVTPGYFLKIACLALPSGPQQTEPTPGDYDPDGAGGGLKVSVLWKNSLGDSETVDSEIEVPASTLEYSTEPDAGGTAIYQLKAYEADNIPPLVLLSAVELRKWSGPGVAVTITVSHEDSARIVDWVIYEEPIGAAKLWTDSDWNFHGYSANGLPLDEYPSQWPIASGSVLVDPALGSEHAIDTLEQQGKQTGPCLFCWSSYSDETATLATTVSYDGGTGDDEGPPINFTNTGFQHLTLGSLVTSFDTNAPGFPLGCGAYGMRLPQGAEQDILRGVTGVVPLVVEVRWKANSGGTATLRLQSSPYSWVELTTTSSSYATTRAIWHAYCGRSPEDSAIAVPLLKVSSGSVDVRYIRGYHLEST